MRFPRYALFVCFLFVSSFCIAQNTTTLTGTVTDSDSQAWVNAQWTATIVIPGGGGQAHFLSGGVVPSQYTGVLNSSGQFPATTPVVGNTAQIVPTGVTWNYCFQPVASTSATCFQQATKGSTFNLGSFVSTFLQGPRITADKINYAYNTTEITNPINGTGYWNTSVSPVTCYVWQSGSYVACGGGGGGGTVNVNSASVSNPNFNGTTPVPSSGNQNVAFQVSGSNVSAQVPNGIVVNVNGASVANPNFNGSTPVPSSGQQNVAFQVSGSSVSAQIPNGVIINGVHCPLGVTGCALTGGSSIAALWGFGTSIVQGAGVPVQGLSYMGLLSGTTTAPVYNQGQGGSTIATDVRNVLFYFAPDTLSPSAMIFESGENDSSPTAGAQTTAVQNMYNAADAWVIIPPQSKLYATACSWTGSNSGDGSFSIFQPTLTLPFGNYFTSVTSGNTGTCTLPDATSYSTKVGVTFGVGAGFTGTFTVSIDGTPQIDNCSGTTTFSSAPCGAYGLVGSQVTWYREEFSVTPSTSHTVVITQTNSSEIAFASVDIFPDPTTNPNISTVMHTAVLANYPSFAAMNPIAVSVVNTLHSDGLPIYYVDMVNGTAGVPGTRGVNTTTDVLQTANTFAAVSGNPGHPNSQGNLIAFQNIIQVEINNGLSFGSLNQVGKGFPNTGVINAPIHQTTYSPNYFGISTGLPAATSLYGAPGNQHQLAIAAYQDTSVGQPWSGQFIMGLTNYFGWECTSNFVAPFDFTSSSYQTTFCIDPTGSAHEYDTWTGAVRMGWIFTVATLPSVSGLANFMVMVSDSATYTPGPCVGGGTFRMIAVSDGTVWSCH